MATDLGASQDQGYLERINENTSKHEIAPGSYLFVQVEVVPSQGAGQKPLEVPDLRLLLDAWFCDIAPLQ